ncbi:MAG: glycosyltransferase family 4 protein [Planctomycetes bacterium]|nr:glycosyltransferase family 4 protein [Planctomycetota bacterium]
MLIVYRYRVPFPNQSAHSIQIAQTIHALARAGAEVWFFPRELTEATPEACLAFYGLSQHSNLHLRLPPQITKRSRAWKGWIARWWENRTFRGRKAVFFLRDGEDSFPYAQHLARRKRDWAATVIMEVHRVHKLELAEYSRPDAPEHERAQVGNRLRRLAEEEGPALRVADGIAPISATLSDALRETYGDLPPMQVLPSGANMPVRESAPLKERSGIVYAGQLYAWKGVPTLLEAMAYLPNVHLSVVGGNKEEEVSHARSLAAHHGVADRVQFLGHVPHAEVQKYLQAARCAVIPLGNDLLARRFTSPIKVFEYMAAGVPIVAADLPTIREVLRDGENALLYPPTDARALAAQVQRVLSDDALAETLRSTALRELQNYSWDERARRIIAFATRLQEARHDE